MIIQAGPDEKVHSVVKIAVVVNALRAEGIASAKALESVALSESDLTSPATRVSLNQVLRCYRNALRLSADPSFAYHTGLRLHVSTYAMYGFAILSSTNFRQTMRFGERYHQLATPTAVISFKEEGDRAEWTSVPVPHPDVDAALYRFLVELQFGALTSILRDVMGPSFAARELHVSYGPGDATRNYAETFGCRVVFGQAENKVISDATWLDGTPKYGNEVTYSLVLGLCDQLMEELQLRTGLVGRVRQALLHNLVRPTSFEAVAKHLKMSTRTLRRDLQEENTSFREVVDELRTQMAIKYLRDTDLTIEDIAVALGFSESASFRQAFRRWTKEAPNEFRRQAKP
ncbi:MAG: AraC family transcriptional regulator [Beijerinckiaceae bacterium]